MQATRVALEFEIQRLQQRVEVLNDRQRDPDLLLGGVRQLQAGELLAGVVAFEAPEPTGPCRHAVMKQHGMDALQPFGALIDERLAQAHAGA
jgi:hypothetical protein